MLFKRTLAACGLVFAGAAGAHATDIPRIVVPPPTIASVPVAPVFTWSGPYVGAYGGYLFGPGQIQAGVQAGYNFDLGGLLAGIEAQAGAVIGGGVGFEGNLNARLGAILGSDFLLYGEGGVGIIMPGAFTYNVGAGVEVAIGPSVSLFAEGKWLGTFGGGFGPVTVQAGLNWHPGY